VKIVAEEQGSAEARAIARDATTVATSPIAYVEARSAIARSRAERRFTPDQLAVAVRTLEVTWPEMAKVPVTDGLIAAAGDVSDRNTIRALDALHVASALNVSANSPEDVLFASWDRDQRKAARREGLVLFPAEL